ncbi:MAG: hypothetical protein BWK79_00825 [Beggiatoa sp. IS2]|nr:MAG: hypothetical protein BWK79_00825 [Beggiatoa sp. IS2]
MSYPFSANGKIEKSELFVGRKYELDFLTNRMLNISLTSLNVYGEPSIGKSSLLYHFYLTWINRVSNKDKDKFIVIYLSLQEAYRYCEEDFYRQVAAELRNTVKDKPQLLEPWCVNHWKREIFTESLSYWKKQNVLPVLCVDDIEKALENKHIFNEVFFDNLLKLICDKQIMLIIASTQSLSDCKVKYGFSSLFFNPTHNVHLHGFLEAEITELLSLGGILTRTERKLAQYWGQSHPYKLQLAALSLCEARQYSEPEKWAKLRFDAQLHTFQLPKYVQWLDVRLKWLKPVNKWLGEIYDKLHPFILGIVIIAVAFFLIKSPSEEVFEFLVQQIIDFFLKIWKTI